MARVLRFWFMGQTDREAIAADIALAIFAAGCIYGVPRVRMETAYAVADDGGSCVLEVGGEAGEIAARVFAGLTTVRVGEDGFRVDHPADVVRDA